MPKIQIDIPESELSTLSTMLKMAVPNLTTLDDNGQEIPRPELQIIEDAIYDFLEGHLYAFKERQENIRIASLKQPVELIKLRGRP